MHARNLVRWNTTTFIMLYKCCLQVSTAGVLFDITTFELCNMFRVRHDRRVQGGSSTKIHVCRFRAKAMWFYFSKECDEFPAILSKINITWKLWTIDIKNIDTDRFRILSSWVQIVSLTQVLHIEFLLSFLPSYNISHL